MAGGPGEGDPDFVVSQGKFKHACVAYSLLALLFGLINHLILFKISLLCVQNSCRLCSLAATPLSSRLCNVA